MKILAIESSADETAAAVVENGVKILSSVVASSTEMHQKYGGIVPEVAARAHVTNIIPVIREALSNAFPQQLNNRTIEQFITSNIDSLAITVGPGLIGSLLVGVETARAIAAVTKLPIIPVNHVLAHMYANFVNHQQSTDNNQHKSESTMEQCNNVTIEFPAISLVVSGGHTELYLMKSVKNLTWLGGTLDDAAGECFDKTARLLGFGNGGGAAIAATAAKFQISKSKFQIKFPHPKMHDTDLNFSFSGLKTAAMREKNALESKQHWSNEVIEQCAYEIQEAITDVLVAKTLKAATHHNAKSILLSGGVAANLRLREKFGDQLFTRRSLGEGGETLSASRRTKPSFHAPPPSLCTDNAVYIASYAYFRGEPTDWKDLRAQPGLSVEM